jgi:hypothetical protein
MVPYTTNDPKLSYLFYIDEVTLKHNELVFFWIDEDVYTIQKKHHDTCLQSFQLQKDANFTSDLHS